MFDRIKEIFRPQLYPMNVIHIYKKHILRNLVYLQSLQPASVLFPVLKSNAYGHGIKEVVKILRKFDTPYLVVDSFPEYQIVKKYSDKKILIIGETLPDNYRKFDLKRTAFAVYNIDTIKALGKLKKHVTVHLFLNTGMNREGIDQDHLSSVLEALKEQKSIYVEGIMSHLYNADGMENIRDIDREIGGEKTSVEKQVEIFKTMYYQILEYGYAPIWRHIGNSAGIFKMKEDFFNAWRPGLAMYGYNPLDKDDSLYEVGQKLKPALSVTSRIISLHQVWPGDGVSYNHKHIFSDREIVGTVPFGYAEGFPRLASGKIFFKLGKKTYKQIGTICMNLCSFLAEDRLEIGEEIELISCDPSDKNSVYALAEASQTIVYECLTRLDKGMRREID